MQITDKPRGPWPRRSRPDVPRSGWEPEELEQVRAAFREWRAVEQYFQQVTDPSLVDHAIYLLKAAEEKYHACLARVRSRGA